MKPFPLNIWSRSSAGTKFGTQAEPLSLYVPSCSACVISQWKLLFSVSLILCFIIAVFLIHWAFFMLLLALLTFTEQNLWMWLSDCIFFLSSLYQVRFFCTLMIASFRTCGENQPCKVNFYDSARLDSLAWILLIKCFLICLQVLPLRPGSSFQCMMQEFKSELYT